MLFDVCILTTACVVSLSFCQAAIDRVVNPGRGSPNLNGNRDFQRLQQKGQSHSFAESRALGGGGGFSGKIGTAGGAPMQRGSSFAAGTALSSTKMPTLNELNDSNFQPRGAAGGGGAVKSGRADTFSPSVFQSANAAASNGNGDNEQGMFVDRSKKEMQIIEVRLRGASAVLTYLSPIPS